MTARNFKIESIKALFMPSYEHARVRMIVKGKTIKDTFRKVNKNIVDKLYSKNPDTVDVAIKEQTYPYYSLAMKIMTHIKAENKMI